MEDDFNNFGEELSSAELTKLLADSASPSASYNQTKKIVWSMVQYKELQMVYACAIKEIQTKFDVLNTEFKLQHKRNPISSISTRLKRTESIIHKLEKNKLPVTLENIENHITDMAGIRVVCLYIDDIYRIADALLKQDDITLVNKKDYIESPKSNGYRSLHLIVKVPVFFADKKKIVPVEVQIRTIAMDFWASLEHQIKYKREIPDYERLNAEFKTCADAISELDQKMLNLRVRVESAQDVLTEDDLLIEKLRKIDTPID